VPKPLHLRRIECCTSKPVPRDYEQVLLIAITPAGCPLSEFSTVLFSALRGEDDTTSFIILKKARVGLVRMKSRRWRHESRYCIYMPRPLLTDSGSTPPPSSLFIQHSTWSSWCVHGVLGPWVAVSWYLLEQETCFIAHDLEQQP